MNVMRLCGFVGGAVVAFVVSGASMLWIPGTPHRRLLEQMHVLDSYRSTPEAPEAGLAFDEFLRIGTQSEVFEATVLSAIAGVTVAVAARLGGPLRIWEALFVAAGFTLIRMVRLSEFVPDAMSLLGTAVFGCHGVGCRASPCWIKSSGQTVPEQE